MRSKFTSSVLFTAIALFAFLPVAYAAVGPAVKVQSRQLLVDFDRDGVYDNFQIKSVGYSPTPIGRHPSDWGWPISDLRPDNIFDDPAILERDFTLLEDMHANAIRIWKGNSTTQADGRFPNKLTKRTLDIAQKHGLKVIAGFWIEDVDFTKQINRDDLIKRFGDYVRTFKDHPAILFWALGNENNYDFRLKPNSSANLKALYSLLNDLAKKAHDIEGVNYHPVAAVNGELNNIGLTTSNAADSQMPALDIWGINVYRGQSFDTLFKDYAAKSQKPLWISEFGVDAWNALLSNPDKDGDPATQSLWIEKLWKEINANRALTVGGSVMEYADEWWKPYEWLCGETSDTCNKTHDHFGSSSPSFPDGTLNEEWFGIVAIAPGPNKQSPDIMKPRTVYFSLQKLWVPHLPPVIASIPTQNILVNQQLEIIIKTSGPTLKGLSALVGNDTAITSLGAQFVVDLNKGEGRLTWTPAAYQRGDYLVVITATNEFELQAKQTFLIRVAQPIPSRKVPPSPPPGPRPKKI